MKKSTFTPMTITAAQVTRMLRDIHEKNPRDTMEFVSSIFPQMTVEQALNIVTGRAFLRGDTSKGMEYVEDLGD